MKDPRALRKHLIDEEGWKDRIYPDSKGIFTIGVGRNLEGKGLSDDEIEYLFSNDMRDAETDVRRVLPQFDDFSANRQIALISVMFAGIRTFMEFKRMIAAINRMDWNTAADELLDSKYAKVDVPNRAKRLAKMLREG